MSASWSMAQFPTPQTYNDVPMFLYAQVPDVDAVFQRAVNEAQIASMQHA